MAAKVLEPLLQFGPTHWRMQSESSSSPAVASESLYIAARIWIASSAIRGITTLPQARRRNSSLNLRLWRSHLESRGGLRKKWHWCAAASISSNFRGFKTFSFWESSESLSDQIELTPGLEQGSSLVRLVGQDEDSISPHLFQQTCFYPRSQWKRFKRHVTTHHHDAELSLWHEALPFALSPRTTAFWSCAVWIPGSGRTNISCVCL